MTTNIIIHYIFTLYFILALPRQLQKFEHRNHHVDELRQARAARRVPRDHGPRDGPQLWVPSRPGERRQLRPWRRGRELHHVRPRHLRGQVQQQEVLQL